MLNRQQKRGDKMSGAGGYKYHVIQFLEVPYKDIADLVCVPKSWVQSRGPGIPIVKVSYPVEEPSLTEERVMKRKKKLNSWKSFLSIMRYSTDNYENAKFYIEQEMNNSKKNKEDHTLLSAKANEKASISTQNAMSRATIDNDAFVVGMIDALGWCVSSKSPNTITLKRKSLPVPDKENCNKRFRVNKPDESDNQVAGPSSKALDLSYKNNVSNSPEDSDEDLCTQETPVEKFNDNSTEIRQTDNKNPTKTTQSLDPKIIAQLATSPMFAKWCKLMQELQEIFDNSMFKELINKLLNKDNDCNAPQNNDPIAFASSGSTVKAPNSKKKKVNKEQRNEKTLEEKDTDNDDDKDQPLENDDSSEEGYLDLDEDEELPPENVELMNKDNDGSGPQNNDPIASVSSDTTVKATKFYKRKINKKPLEKKHIDSDYDKNLPLNKKRYRERIEKAQAAYDDSSEDSDLHDYEELPPEYDANDSRWTLRYHEPAPENVELMPHTGVYVTNYKVLPKRTIPLAIKLLRGIFTKNALDICGLPGRGTKSINRPALDEHAFTVFMYFVNDHAIEDVDPYYILKSLRHKMRGFKKDCRIDYGWRPSQSAKRGEIRGKTFKRLGI